MLTTVKCKVNIATLLSSYGNEKEHQTQKYALENTSYLIQVENDIQEYIYASSIFMVKLNKLRTEIFHKITFFHLLLGRFAL